MNLFIGLDFGAVGEKRMMQPSTVEIVNKNPGLSCSALIFLIIFDGTQ
jgi:hypothetical protein